MLYIPIWFYFNVIKDIYRLLTVGFTFQYGSTLILLNIHLACFFKSFTFQYGSTLIFTVFCLLNIYIILYIPIWFYFNAAQISIKCTFLFLYIPIWFYFNFIFVLLMMIVHYSLHSNMVLL